MKMISKNKLKTKLLKFLRIVEPREKEVVVTGRESVALGITELNSHSSSHPLTEELFEKMRGEVKYFEDLTTPTDEEWNEL